MLLGVRETTHKDPRPYQEDDIAFHIEHPFSMNNAQPGMGKTLIAIETMMRTNTQRILVICPNYLTEQWKNQILDQYPTSTICLPKGTKGERATQLMESVLSAPQWTIINKEMLRTLPIIPIYDGVIIDESHHMANRTSAVTKAAIELTKSPAVKRLLLLTATPIRKEPDDLWAQLHMLDSIGAVHITSENYYKFVSRYCFVTNGRFGTHVRGGRTRDIKEMLTDYAISHTYNQVHLQLPRLIEYNDKLELSAQEKKAYLLLKAYWQIEAKSAGFDFDSPKYMTNAMQVMTFLRRMTMCQSKLEAVRDIIEDTTEPVVIYTWFREGAEKIAAYLKDKSAVDDIAIITGSIPANERADIARNQNVVVATLASLSEGVDLSHARCVIFAEEYWQPAMMYQALSRVRRWSNDNRPIIAHYLQMESTIDEIVHDAQRNRHQTIGEIMKRALED